MITLGDSTSIVGVFFEWFRTLFMGFVGAFGFITQPIITLGDIEFSILSLFTFAGVTAFLAVAVVKWLL